ncbi:MAG: RNA methyltransferase, partial [Alphaproteobacteria bacterium]
LDNDEVALADAIVQVPLNPAFSSLNLAQAVLLIGYEWFLGGDASPATALKDGTTRPATRDELEGFLRQLEEALGASGFLRPPEKGPRTVRNLRNIFTRAGLMEQEVQTLRGVVSSFTKKRGGA